MPNLSRLPINHKLPMLPTYTLDKQHIMQHAVHPYIDIDIDIDIPIKYLTKILKRIIITPILCLLASSLYLCSFSSSDCISEGSTSVSSSLLYLSSLGATVIVDLIALSSLPSLCVHHNIYCTGISVCDSTFTKKYQKKKLSCIAL